MIVSDNRTVIAIHLDSGTLYLSENTGNIGTDDIVPGILQMGVLNAGINFQVEKSALPATFSADLWINREASVIDVSPSAGSVWNGTTLFDGIVVGEPTDSDGILSVSIAAPKKKVIPLPNFGEITTTEFPNAPDQSQGKLKPLLYGSVERAELLPVDVRFSSTLKIDAAEDDKQLFVSDATGFSNSGSVIIDGQTYAYTSRSDNTLLGMAIGAIHRAGTMVAQSGQAVYLAAGHAIASLSNVLLDDEIDSSGVVDLNAATLTFPSLPAVDQVKARENILAEFDQVDAANTASNAVNAIRAITATDSNINTSTALPYSLSTGAVELTRTGELLFPSPSQDHIVKGSYSITFSVNHNGNAGNATVSIGNQIVWVLNGGSVVYNNSPATFFFDNDANSLPISIERDSTSGSIDLTVTAATRTISLGNVDASAYALVPVNKKLVVNQTTVMPNRGSIKRARLAVEWFATDQKFGVASVKFDGVQVGELDQNNLGKSTQSDQVVVDIVNQGNAQLLSSDINKSFSGGTASLSNTVTLFNESFPASYIRRTNDISGFARWYVQIFVKPPANVNTSAFHTAYVTYSGGAGGSFGFAGITIYSDITRGINFDAAGGTQNMAVQVLSPNNTIQIWGTLNEGLDIPSRDSGAEAETALAKGAKALSIRIEWDVTPVQQNNTPTFQSVSQSNRTLPNSGITTSHSGAGQTIQFVIPAPPRTIINYFDLPRALVDGWGYFTNKQVDIAYTGGGAEDIAVVRAVLLIDYDVIVRKNVGLVTANITGKSGNPADVIADIASVSNQQIDAAALSVLQSWATSNSYSLARRVNKKSDALKLLGLAATQTSVMLADRDKTYPVRWFQPGIETQINDEDLLQPSEIGWSKAIHNNITLRYRYDGSDYTRVIVADSTNNAYCAKSKIDIREELFIEVQAGFIADDATAAIFLTDYARRYAPLRHFIRLELPFTFDSLRVGDKILYRDWTLRITEIGNDNGWLSVSAEELI